MKRKIVLILVIFSVFVACNCYAGFVFTDVLSDHVTYDSTYWTKSEQYYMVAAAQVEPSTPSYDPLTSPVYVSGGPITTTLKLHYFSGWYSYLFAKGLGEYGTPSPAWENNTYDFQYTIGNDTTHGYFSINPGDIQEIDPPQSVTYDQDSRTVTWQGANTDVFTIRILPLDSNGDPDIFKLIWSSGHIKGTNSYVLPEWGPSGYYALRFESREYRAGTEGSTNELLNRSIYYTKIYNPVPLPGSIFLFISGCLGLFGIRRKFASK